MANRYSFHDMGDLTPSELFFWVAVDETLKQLGVKDLVAGALVLAGQPILGTATKLGGATIGTSPASVVSRKLLNYELRTRLPTITNASFRTMRFMFTKNLGAFVGRAVPVVGWLILAYDVEEIIRHSILSYNAIAKPDDRFAL